MLDSSPTSDELGVEQQELTEMLFRKAPQNGTSPEHEMQHMMEHNHTPEWMQEIRRDKALRLIVRERHGHRRGRQPSSTSPPSVRTAPWPRPPRTSGRGGARDEGGREEADADEGRDGRPPKVGREAAEVPTAE